MTLRIRHLQLRISTEQGLMGADLSFRDGLTVIRADNSMGKSTCLQAIIYALGLEAMFGGSRNIPLPQNMTDSIDTGHGTVAVLDSEVLLEIENAEGRRLTLKRPVKTAQSRNLISVYDGPLLTKKVSAPYTDYFVRDPGSATHEAGFHTLLASFIGWRLPLVPRYDGRETQLYMEVLFPLLFLEQKKGWAAIEGRFPTQYAIRDVGARAVEYLLALDAYSVETRKQELRAAAENIRSEWAHRIASIAQLARSVSATAQGYPQSPTSTWPPAPQPSLALESQDGTRSIRDEIRLKSEELSALQGSAVPTVAQNATHDEHRLAELAKALTAKESELRSKQTTAATERAELDSLQSKLASLELDIVRNHDAVKLKQLGSVKALSISDDHCPTCHQEIGESLLTSDELHEVTLMSVEENLDYLKEQRRMYEFLLEQAKRNIELRSTEIEAATTELSAIRAEIRAIQQTLISDDRLPAASEIERRVRLAQYVSNLKTVEEKTGDLSNSLEHLSANWAEIQAALADLPERLSETDEAKLRAMETSIRQQLREYGMESVSPQSISLSRNNYRPVHEGFELQFGLSASDTIRTTWAHRTALLEVARSFETNHPGLVIFDEPRQQATASISLRNFFRRLSATDHANQQAIVATSESASSLERDLEGIECDVISFTGRILKSV